MPYKSTPKRHADRLRSGLAALAALVALSLLAPLAAADHPVDEGCAVTPGGWGAEPEGNNPGALLHGHFDEVFGDELVVDGHTFEDAQDVTDALPNEGDPLFSHAVALAINLAFGDAGLLDGTLSGVEVEGGPYDGKTAEEMLALAEDALEDPERSTSKYSDLIDAITDLNEEQFGCNEVEEVPCPDNLAAIPQENGSIKLTWDDVEGADAYNVYRATGAAEPEDEDFMLLDTTTDTEYTDTTTAPGQTYWYIVTAVDGTQESQDCEPVMATAIPFFPGLLAGVLAVGGSLGAFAWLRRKA